MMGGGAMAGGNAKCEGYSIGLYVTRHRRYDSFYTHKSVTHSIFEIVLVECSYQVERKRIHPRTGEIRSLLAERPGTSHCRGRPAP